MGAAIPALDRDRQRRVAEALRAFLPARSVLWEAEDTRPYECDGLTAYRQVPMVVALPETEEEVRRVLRTCHDLEVPVVPRGAGTGLSGGALPPGDGVLLSMAKFMRVVRVGPVAQVAVVQPGVRNAAISDVVAPFGLYYAPDPSSQIACTIGGNVAENSGGVHCLKYGLTTNNVLGAEVVLMDGQVVRFGGKQLDSGGYDLLGVLVGSEGLLGVVTEVTVRLLKRPETQSAVLLGFPKSEQAGACVAAIIEAGIIPGGMEMMDRPAIHAAEAFVKAGYPLDVEALLIVELDGPKAEVDELCSSVTAIAERCGAVYNRTSQSEQERLRFWAGRKAAFPAVGRISPDYYCMDGTIPRKHLAHVLSRIEAMQDTYGLRCANVFHAGDGNMHPLIMFDANKPGELQRAEDFGAAILALCVEVGGTITGEHGVGVEKIDSMCVQFGANELEAFFTVKRAFDPAMLLNPNKAVPTLQRCAEMGKMRVSGGVLPFADLPRF